METKIKYVFFEDLNFGWVLNTEQFYLMTLLGEEEDWHQLDGLIAGRFDNI